MQNQNANPEQLYKAILTIWAALLMSQCLFVALVLFVKPNLLKFDLTKPLLGDNGAIVLAFAAVSLLLVALSFVLKKRLLDQAVNEQKPALVQSALVVACALAEAVSLLGLATAFVFDYQYFFLFSAVGIGTALLHFPKRSDIHVASFRSAS